ncbi:MAG: PcfB family protein [Oscillospiraceae bacterium]|nr:PcfB family protein [Oscillospiraceae bacterium]
MNIGGGEAADQLVRMMLSGTEVAVRLSGSALKNMLALTMALAKNNKTLSGKVNLGKMLRETRDLRQFPMTPEQYKQFSRLAKKQKILFSAIRDKDDRGKLVDVILPVTELDRANMIFDRLAYIPLARQEERSAPQRAREASGGPQQERSRAQGREDQNRFQQPQDGPVQEAVLSKKDSRSERDSPATRLSSSTPKENGALKATSERPSIEARLNGYRVQLRNSSVPAKVISKAKNKAKTR